MRISKLCFEVNGGSCKHKVSARNGFVCAAGHGKGNDAARPTISISKMSQDERLELARVVKGEAIQWEMFHTRNSLVRQRLAGNPSIGEAIQWEMFRAGDESVQFELIQNPSIGEDLQWEIFHTTSGSSRFWLAHNPSVSRELAIELAKVGQAPFGYLKNKPIAELMQPENLALLNQYPKAFSHAYLRQLLSPPQEDREESKTLILHSYLVYEKSGGGSQGYYKDKILERYAGDQEVALILSAEPAQ